MEDAPYRNTRSSAGSLGKSDSVRTSQGSQGSSVSEVFATEESINLNNSFEQQENLNTRRNRTPVVTF